MLTHKNPVRGGMKWSREERSDDLAARLRPLELQETVGELHSWTLDTY
jgi:hypothetical protein